MNTVNHALWGATLGRTIGRPIEGAIIASLPDLLMAPGFAYVWLKQGYLNVETAPRWTKTIYSIVHNWWLGLGVVLVLYVISPPLAILGLGYFWHIFQDAFLHIKMAISFLWPVWNGKIKSYSAMEHWWVQAVDFLAIIVVNILLSYYHL